ncbi:MULTISPECIES: hypothetical protein [Streptomyces]|uniref:hypothetical protein n=1 Tax=Streptomyces TaxID=1883 RepID=UPI001D0AE055|nr:MULTISPECIES: hypothetical protein [Streptomyces]MCX5084649.1 hypothetical protein [Streptomyces sp. NBC_00401]UDM04052.1 hypothetical protein LGI35_40275 [Streptomyces longhuiensis]
MTYGVEEPPGTGPLFRLAWRGSPYAGRPAEDLWIAFDGDAEGGWWFDAYFLGRLPLGHGAPRAAEFARWLLTAPPTGPYEREFTLIDREPQAGSPRIAAGTRLTVEFLLGREEPDGPEYLHLLPSGETAVRHLGFEVCAPLECEPLPRASLEVAAAGLLDAATDQGSRMRDRRGPVRRARDRGPRRAGDTRR